MSQAGKLIHQIIPPEGFIHTLTGDTGGPVEPDGVGNINVIGDLTTTEVEGDPVLNTLVISVKDSFADEYVTDSGTAIPLNYQLNIVGSGALSTSGSGNTVTIAPDETIATEYTTDDNNTAIPAVGNLNIFGGDNIRTTSAGSTVTVSVDDTTEHSVQIGNAAGSLTSLGVATDGQLIIGSSGADPVLATLTAGTGISISTGAGSIEIEATGGGGEVSTLSGDSGGTVLPDSQNILLEGGSNITTLGVPADNKIVFNVSGVDEDRVAIGAADGSLTTLPVMTNGQLIIGDTGNTPTVTTLTSGAGIDITNASGSITITNTGIASTTTYISDSGNAQPDGSNELSVVGQTGRNISTSGAGNTLEIAVSGVTEHSAVVGDTNGALSSLGVATNGQLIIGSSGADPVLAVLTAGAGINITNGAGSIEIEATGGGLQWHEELGTAANLDVNEGVISNNVADVTLTLPTVAALGSVIRVTQKGVGLVKIAQNAGQQIHYGSLSTTAGAGGYIEATEQFDSVELLCILADAEFVVLSSTGNWDVN